MTGGWWRVKASQLARGRLEINTGQARLQWLPLALAPLLQPGAGVSTDKLKRFLESFQAEAKSQGGI